MKKLVMLVLFAFSGALFSQSADALLQAKLNAIRTMTASFSQVVKAKRKEMSRSTGTMALKRPGNFRWQTAEPLEQLIVADGKKMWVYDVDLEQVTVKKQEKGLGGTAALFLSGYDETITKDFEVTQSGSGKQLTFDLKAKSPKENFTRIKLIFTADKLTGIELQDQLGQLTQVKLSNIKSNPTLAGSLFQFKPPKGVDVVQQ